MDLNARPAGVAVEAHIVRATFLVVHLGALLDRDTSAVDVSRHRHGRQVKGLRKTSQTRVDEIILRDTHGVRRVHVVHAIHVAWGARGCRQRGIVRVEARRLGLQREGAQQGQIVHPVSVSNHGGVGRRGSHGASSTSR